MLVASEKKFSASEERFSINSLDSKASSRSACSHCSKRYSRALTASAIPFVKDLTSSLMLLKREGNGRRMLQVDQWSIALKLLSNFLLSPQTFLLLCRLVAPSLLFSPLSFPSNLLPVLHQSKFYYVRLSSHKANFPRDRVND